VALGHVETAVAHRLLQAEEVQAAAVELVEDEL
jgi:hypothetical protein